MDYPTSVPGRGKKCMSSAKRHTGMRPTQPHISRMSGVKRPVFEADHSPPSHTEVKND
jgi:hypothetical protein